MKQTIEIEVPDGKKAVWEDGKVVFENIEPQLPKTWEEYCEKTPLNLKEAFITQFSGIISLDDIQYNRRDPISDRNLLETEEDARAYLALMQLHRLRDCYRQGWKPNWKGYYYKWCINKQYDTLYVDWSMVLPNFLSFQSKEIAEEFLNNFRDLIEQAGDLI